MKHISLTRYLIEEQCKHNTIPAELHPLPKVVARICRVISYSINKRAFAGVLGSAGIGNVQGETQQKLDVIVNEVLFEANEYGGNPAAMASEEMESFYEIPHRYPKGGYPLLFDPLDGSSNIDVNVSIGTIFSVLCAPKAGEAVTEADFMQPGSKQVAAGYAVCGPQTTLMLTVGNDVHMLTLDCEVGSFVLTYRDVKIPVDTKEFVINMSNTRHWAPPARRYIDEYPAGTEGPRGKDFNTYWIASMVADVYRTLTRGGIFMYPRDKREPDKVDKLRLTYEASPMAFLVKQAGGAATSGGQRILDTQPERLYQHVVVVLGSRSEVDRVMRYRLEVRQTS